MRLQKKTFLLIGITTICMIVILYAVAQSIILNSFAELEKQHTHENVQLALNVLSDEISQLSSITGDWAAWDDVYSFVEDRNEAFTQSNIDGPTFANLRVNLMLFVNSSGQIVYGKMFDLQNLTEIPVPQGFQEQLSANELLWRHTDTESNVEGLILQEVPMLIASRPILTSHREGPIQGTLIWGRFFDSAEIEYLAKTVRLPLIVHRFNDSQIPSDFQVAGSSLSTEAPIFTQPLNGSAISGYGLVNDIYGTPLLILRIEMPRDIYRQGQTTINYFTLSLFTVCLVVGIVTGLLLEKDVLSPLNQLTTTVRRMGKSKNFSERVSMAGDDELAILGEAINNMITEKLATMEEVAAMVGHDLRNPLMSISNAAYYLKKKYAPKLDDKAMEMLETIEKDIKYANGIISDLLEYSRKMKLKYTEKSPKSMLEDVLSIMHIPKNIQVMNLTESEPEMKVDADKMQRVFVNIIKNAIEAMPDGGKLTIKNRKSNEKMEIVFSDTGVGMPKESLEKIFQPLFSTKAKGMGLGLAICKRIVEAHGGRISVGSSVGIGTTFTVTIPVKPKLEGGEEVWVKQPKSLLSTTMKA